MQDKTERSQFRLPERADWLASYVKELMNFPNAKDLDQVDSSAWAVKRLLELGPPRHTTEQPSAQQDLYADTRYKGWRDRLDAIRARGRHRSHMSA